jgi:wobble nucleotide-excising tRNase
LGSDNNDIIDKIKILESELGEDSEDKKTGLFLEKKSKDETRHTAKISFENKQTEIEKLLQNKATRNLDSIKASHSKYGDINYNITKLRDEINIVLEHSYKPSLQEDLKKLEKIIEQKRLDEILYKKEFTLEFHELTVNTKQFVEQKVGQSNTIQELVNNRELEKWVESGKNIHENDHSECKFCNQKIEPEYWLNLNKKLNQHFDEESKNLESNLNNFIAKINLEIKRVENLFNPKKELFYVEFHQIVENLKLEFDIKIQEYIKSLERLKTQLENKLKAKFSEITFEMQIDYSEDLIKIWKKFEDLRQKSNDYSKDLNTEQSKAKEILRLNEVYKFVNEVNYPALLNEQNRLFLIYDTAKKKHGEILDKIQDKKQVINSLKSKLTDEKLAADKVNQYLNHYFGHQFLQLNLTEKSNLFTDIKTKTFQIERNGNPAYNLSEGECSLISFCYFLAKLQDHKTDNQKPIIWIDDPISSLDSNHIFFVYSLINSEIVQSDNFSQLFISTHNLEFLKYLKRIQNRKGNYFGYFVIERTHDISCIRTMPDYMKNYVTEFNYLFEQIQRCADEDIGDGNIHLFYSFGNNARKFLEMYLHFRFPSGEIKKTKQLMNHYSIFFGSEDKIPSIIASRINNEKSHLGGNFETASNMNDNYEEIKKTAKLIIEIIKKDVDQYSSLVSSI